MRLRSRGVREVDLGREDIVWDICGILASRRLVLVVRLNTGRAEPPYSEERAGRRGEICHREEGVYSSRLLVTPAERELDRGSSTTESRVKFEKDIFEDGEYEGVAQPGKNGAGRSKRKVVRRTLTPPSGLPVANLAATMTSALTTDERIAAALSSYNEALNFSNLSSAASDRHAEYLMRLRSFKASTWFAKPSPLTPPFVARHGWKNTGPDMLTCVKCSSNLCFTFDPSLPPFASSELAAKYAESLKTGHKTSCAFGYVPDPSTYEELDVGGADKGAVEARVKVSYELRSEARQRPCVGETATLRK